jgi:predicted transcriptional regulator
MSATMTFKEEALLAISRLPARATTRQVRETVDILAALRESERASVAGRVFSHDEVVRRFRSWRKK